MIIRDSETSEILFRMEYEQIKEIGESVSFTPEVGRRGGSVSLPSDRNYVIETDGGYIIGRERFLSVC